MYFWYTLYTKPHNESRVEKILLARGVEVFLPLVQNADKLQWEVFFPCYLFVRCDAEQGMLLQARWTPGVRDIVSFGGVPATVDERIIRTLPARLKQIEAEGGLPSQRYVPGDHVRITKGPLAGLEAVFQGPTTPKQRVRILLQFLGHPRAVEVASGDLEPNKEPRRVRKGRNRYPPREDTA
ncbi:MAG: hypothetical protein HY326_12140 [Chloroflexi bacterium]|nr:hypothetical protein [Chloroflexota bacterium]